MFKAELATESDVGFGLGGGFGLVGVRGGGQAVAGRRWCRGSSLHGAFDETVPPGGAETVLSTKLGLCHSPAVPMMLPGYLASSFKEVQQWQKARLAAAGAVREP